MSLWEELQALDEDATRARLHDFLEPAQLKALFERRDELVARWQEEIGSGR